MLSTASSPLCKDQNEGSCLPCWAKHSKYSGSLSVTVQEQACPKALPRHLFVTELSCLLLLIQNELTSAQHSDRTPARKQLGLPLPCMLLQLSTHCYPGFFYLTFKERNTRPISAAHSTHVFTTRSDLKCLRQAKLFTCRKALREHSRMWMTKKERYGNNKSLPWGIQFSWP